MFNQKATPKGVAFYCAKIVSGLKLNGTFGLQFLDIKIQ